MRPGCLPRSLDKRVRKDSYRDHEDGRQAEATIVTTRLTPFPPDIDPELIN